MNIKEIHIPESFEQSASMEYRVTRNIDDYEKNGDVYKKILVKRDHKS